MQPILDVRNLKSGFETPEGSLIAVDGVSFQLNRGETLGLVGESGCGKSVTSLSLMRLLPKHSGKIYSGQVLFNGQDLLQLPEPEMRKLRGNDLAMIFQEPMTALNPVFSCGHQIEETIQIHNPKLPREQIKSRALEMLELVGIPEPARRANEYPHQLSGGMRQRVMIAMALACNPQLLIADEPTTALDVTIQAQILDLIRRLQKQMQASMILITHDLGVVAEVCDRVAVMYAGRIVEFGTVEDIFYRPQHKYTQGLLKAVPHFDSSQRKKRLTTIQGVVPSLKDLPKGCRFHPRCSFADEECRKNSPELSSVNKQHSVACFHAEGTEGADHA